MKAILKLAIVPVLLGALTAAYWLGRRDVWILELKTYEGNLIVVQNFQTNLPPQLGEFLKARYYFLANKVPRNWMPTKNYGPVSDEVAKLGIGKGPTTAKHEYESFKLRLASSD